jgi:hypothetical protein
MSSAVHNLQRAISNGSQPLVPLLRQTKLIAAKLNLVDVETWVDHELRGYPSSKKLPDYRQVHSGRLEMYHPIYHWRFIGNPAATIAVCQPIAEIENLAQGDFATISVEKNYPVDDGMGGGMMRNWPQRLIISNSQYKRIMEAVTDELLQWTIALERRGIKGDDMNFDENEKQSAGNMVFNIGSVQGNVGSVSHSQANFQNYSSIHQLLVDRNVPMNERHELEKIVEEMKTASPEKQKSLIERGKAWVVKNRDFLGASGEIVAKTISAAIPKS